MRSAVAAPTVVELAAEVRSGRASPVDLVERALARLAACDGDVGAFVAVDAEAARREAQAAPAGPLQGVPFGVKDLFDVAGQVTRAGSRVPPDPPAARDAAAVARLRAAGAVVLGRTRTHEFAWGITTQHEELGGTRNPWDTSRVPGGSSGGSAAAVAAGIVPFALGTDTGCSIRLPAAWCGLVGHKPTWGAVSLAGCVPLAPSLDHGGVLVRSVTDVRLVLSVLSAVELAEPAPVTGLHAGLVRGPSTPGVGTALDGAVRRAEALGLRLRALELPLADRLADAYVGVQAGEALAWHEGTGRWPAHADLYGREVRGYLQRAQESDPERGRASAALRKDLRRQMAAVFAELDVLLLPVAGSGPPLVTSPDRCGLGPVRDVVLPWTVLANLCGLPACSVPVGVDEDGLPVGLQVLGPPGADGRVLDVAQALQVALPWPQGPAG